MLRNSFVYICHRRQRTKSQILLAVDLLIWFTIAGPGPLNPSRSWYKSTKTKVSNKLGGCGSKIITAEYMQVIVFEEVGMQVNGLTGNLRVLAKIVCCFWLKLWIVLKTKEKIAFCRLTDNPQGRYIYLIFNLWAKQVLFL